MFQVNSKLLPKDFSREFDAHIYFLETELEAATFLRDQMKIRFNEQIGQQLFFVGDMIPVAIGPHPKPMFEANFTLSLFSDVVLWLMKERGEFSVLVHPLSGDGLYDHTQGAMWLGPSIELIYSRL